MGYGYPVQTGNKKEFSLKDAASQLDIGRNTLMKKLREIGILNYENRPTKEGTAKGFIDDLTVRRKVGCVPATKVNEDGFSFLQELIKNNPELFSCKKRTPIHKNKEVAFEIVD